MPTPSVLASRALCALAAPLAEIPYPRIDPVAFRIFGFDVRWYGISYILSFAIAAILLRSVAKRGRWPVHPDRVLDVLFWGILGVMVGGRVGHMLIYAEDRSFGEWFNFRKGGMAFHGGLAGVIIAYAIYGWRTRLRFRDIGDGLAIATPLGIFCVRIANFINAELVGRVWDGTWAMQFPGRPGRPGYVIGEPWDGRWETTLSSNPALSGNPVLRHPSQLYQALGEGLCVFLILWWLMIKRGWGAGRVGAMFAVLYGTFRFVAEYFREPEDGYGVFGMTVGQELCAMMVVLGLVALWFLRHSKPMEPIDWTGVDPGASPPASPASPSSPASAAP